MLANAPGMQRVGSAGTSTELIAKFRILPSNTVFLSARVRTDVLTETIKTIVMLRPGTAIVVFGAPESASLAIDAIREGASAFLACEASSTSTGSVSTLPGSFSLPRPRATVEQGSALSKREIEVLRGISLGKTNNEIGSDLHLAEDTVKTHAQRLFRKLAATDRAHAVGQAMRKNLIS
ncbi:response regulator transcription factor [Amycolatopsis sp. NPDC051071]|uniref:helix-turn-helix transcriptional regulator n=1 Tax=Amycolatopsis sp. NPDC051071 TaxID=3154637 RepID=UPI003422E155